MISALTRLNGSPTLKRKSIVFDHGDRHALRSMISPDEIRQAGHAVDERWRSADVPLVNVTSFALAGM